MLGENVQRQDLSCYIMYYLSIIHWIRAWETVWDHREKFCDLRMKNMSCILVMEEKMNKMDVKIEWNQIKLQKNCGSVLLNIHGWLPMILQLHVGDFDFGCNICSFEVFQFTMVLLYTPLWVLTLPLPPFPSQYLDSNTVLAIPASGTLNSVANIFLIGVVLSVGVQTQWGTKGDIKEGLELTPMGSFDVGQRGHQLQTW